MHSMTKPAAALLVSTALLAGLAASADATTFAAWQVTNVPAGDVLNVRKYPSSSSQIQSSYPNGTTLQMTGRCTGGVDLLAVAGLAAGEQKRLVRYRWCEIWHDPARDGSFATGWVYGRYIRPR